MRKTLFVARVEPSQYRSLTIGGKKCQCFGDCGRALCCRGIGRTRKYLKPGAIMCNDCLGLPSWSCHFNKCRVLKRPAAVPVATTSASASQGAHAVAEVLAVEDLPSKLRPLALCALAADAQTHVSSICNAAGCGGAETRMCVVPCHLWQSCRCSLCVVL